MPPYDWIPVVTDHSIQPSWAPDGSGVYHFSDRDGHMCAWLQRVDAATKRPVGEPQGVLQLHQPSVCSSCACAAADERRPVGERLRIRASNKVRKHAGLKQLSRHAA